MQMIDQENWIATDYGFFYAKEKIKFIRLTQRLFLKDFVQTIKALHGDQLVGVICSSLEEGDLKLLTKLKISYLIPDRELKIFSASSSAPTPPKTCDSPYTNPIRIISPTGLEIVDVILKLDHAERQLSASKIASAYQLSRSKLSIIMTAFQAKTIDELRTKIFALPLDWWPKAFDLAICKRKMTPFRTKNTRRYILNHLLSAEEFQTKVDELQSQHYQVVIGGLSYLKVLHQLNTSEFDLLINLNHLPQVLEYFNLRPATSRDVENIVYITPAISELECEKLETKKSFNLFPNIKNEKSNVRKINMLRYLWGLNYHEARIDELRHSLLENYFYALGKDDH